MCASCRQFYLVKSSFDAASRARHGVRLLHLKKLHKTRWEKREGKCTRSEAAEMGNSACDSHVNLNHINVSCILGFEVVGQSYSPRRCVAVRGVLDEIGVDLQ